MSINLILATDINGGLGIDNKLLFDCKLDMKRFRDLTMSHYTVMGSNTWLSLPAPLKGRTNVILSRNEEFPIDPHLSNKHDVILHNDLNKIINHYNSGTQEKELFIVGGAEVYRQAVMYADKVYLTLFHHEREHDTSFPLEVLDNHFEVVHKDSYEVDGLRFDFIDYVRKGDVGK